MSTPIAIDFLSPPPTVEQDLDVDLADLAEAVANRHGELDAPGDRSRVPTAFGGKILCAHLRFTTSES